MNKRILADWRNGEAISYDIASVGGVGQVPRGLTPRRFTRELGDFRPHLEFRVLSPDREQGAP